MSVKIMVQVFKKMTDVYTTTQKCFMLSLQKTKKSFPFAPALKVICLLFYLYFLILQ